MSHQHSHHCCCGHSGSDSEEGYNLYSKIDFDSFQCLNEAKRGSGRTVFKPFDSRHDQEHYVDSEVDSELLFTFKFAGSVKLESAIISGGNQGTHPAKLKIFKNVTIKGFSGVPSKADIEFNLSDSPTEMHVLNTQSPKMWNISSLSLLFMDNHGGENSRIYYIGLKGQFDKANKQGVLLYNYEITPNPADVESPADVNVNRTVF